MKLIILDRDGVINHESRAFVKSPDEWIPIPGSLEAIGRLTKAGYTITLATNQSGLARGYFDLATLEAIHAKLQNAAATFGGKINKIYFCPHGPNDNCECRKPKPGMLKQLESDFAIDIAKLKPPFVGDSLRDIELAIATGCRPFLTTGPGSDGEETLTKLSAEQLKLVTVVENLAAATNLILGEE